MIQKRDLALCIILSIVTCGIYGLYWMYSMTEDVAKLSNKTNLSGGLSVLLTIITCGIYGYYWSYQMGKNLCEAKQIYSRPYDDKSVLFLILSILRLDIVNYILIQSDINDLVK